MTLPVAVLGATGRMGRLVVAEVLAHEGTTLAAAITRPESSLIGADAGEVAGAGRAGVPIQAVGAGCFGGAEVIIDFSMPHALAAALPELGHRALVTGTTGLSPAQIDVLYAQAGTGPVLVAANFSTGVNVMLDLVARAARLLPDYDIEIVEAHHRHKVDAPSGTALALGHAAANARGQDLNDLAVHGREGAVGPRKTGSIGMHAIRGGDVVGEHRVWITGAGERIEISHTAQSRSTFAGGALRAAIWLAGMAPGRYTMADILGL